MVMERIQKNNWLQSALADKHFIYLGGTCREYIWNGT